MVRDIERYLTFIDSRAPDDNYHVVRVAGIKLHVHPGVWNPSKGKSSKMFARVLRRFNLSGDISALDIGTGTGFLPLILWKRGIKRIVAVDKSRNALANARRNFKLHGAENIPLKVSNLFSNAPGRFNLVLFNAPAVHPKRAAVTGSMDALWSGDGNVLLRFLDSLEGHLAPNGRALVMYSRFEDFDPLSQHVRKRYPFTFRALTRSKGALSESVVLEVRKK